MANNYSEFVTSIKDLTKEEKEWLSDTLKNMKDSERDFASQWDDTTLWLSSLGKSYNPVIVIKFMQDFLKKFRKDGYLYFTSAFTCSVARLNEFGGAAFFITAKNVKSVGTLDWAQAEVRKFEKRRSK